MMCRLTINLAITISLALPALAQAYHTGYWKKSTPTGQSAKCTLVETADQLKVNLEAVGWRSGDGLPTIDWAEDCAIIIAPSTYYKDGSLGFYGLKWSGSRFELEYGWQTLSSETTTGGSYTAGSSAEGTPETIVVSFKHSVHSENELVCSNLGLVR